VSDLKHSNARTATVLLSCLAVSLAQRLTRQAFSVPELEKLNKGDKSCEASLIPIIPIMSVRCAVSGGMHQQSISKARSEVDDDLCMEIDVMAVTAKFISSLEHESYRILFRTKPDFSPG
jgi:hypothetical protein